MSAHATATERNIGHVTQIIGSTFDAEFAEDKLPEIYNALVVETDSPYLPPQRLRGRRNDPTSVLEAIRVVAEVRGQSQDEIVKATSDNARRLFRL